MSVAIQRKYPQGPITCEEDPSCEPKFPDGEHFFTRAVLYFWLLYSVLILVWSAWRLVNRKKGRYRIDGENLNIKFDRRGSVNTSNYSRRSLEIRNSIVGDLETPLLVAGGSDAEVNELEDRGSEEGLSFESENVQMLGYKSAWLGDICVFGMRFVSFFVMLMFLAVIVDFYHGCEVEGLDNLCFFGNYFLFGNADSNQALVRRKMRVCMVFDVF